MAQNLAQYRTNQRIIEIEQGMRVAQAAEAQYFNGVEFTLHNWLHSVRFLRKRPSATFPSGEIFGYFCSCGHASR